MKGQSVIYTIENLLVFYVFALLQQCSSGNRKKVVPETTGKTKTSVLTEKFTGK